MYSAQYQVWSLKSSRPKMDCDNKLYQKFFTAWLPKTVIAKIGGHPDKPAQNVQKIKANLCREEIATSTATVFWKLRRLKRSQMVSACFINTHVVHACQREPAENHLGNLLPNVPDPWPHRLHSWKVLHTLGYSQNGFFVDVTSVPTCQPTHITCMLTSVPTSTFSCAQYFYRMCIFPACKHLFRYTSKSATRHDLTTRTLLYWLHTLCILGKVFLDFLGSCHTYLSASFRNSPMPKAIFHGIVFN